MAMSEKVKTITIDAGSDLSAGQFKAVVTAADGQIDLVAGSGSRFDGVLYNKPTAAGRAATVAISGRVKMVAGTGNVTRGQNLMSDADGRAITGASTGFSLGRCLKSALDGEMTEVLLGGPGGHNAIS